MKLFVMAVRDHAAESFSKPLFFPSIGLAVRSFIDEASRAEGNSPLAVHTRDFDLYHLGYFEDSDGSFDMLHTHQLVMAGSSVALKGSENAS